MRTIAVFLIVLYQRFISPYKGFRCAHAAWHGGASCSGAVRAIVEREGLWGGWPLIRRRFAECRVAAQQQRPETEEEKRRRRRREEWNRNCDCGEAACVPLDGVDCVDCSAMDCGGMDCGGMDCAPADCSISLFRPRPRDGVHSAQGS